MIGSKIISDTAASKGHYFGIKYVDTKEAHKS